MLGAAYYPEDWDESEQAHDIEYMQKAGISVVRIAEFAWSCMEPEEGKFDFEWLHRVVDRLGEAGIAVIMGTPSATPPIWLEEKDSTMFRVDENGLRELHGGRRHCCSNNPTYRKYSARIAEKLAMEFGADERVIGWQIDNEICVKGLGCFCDECKKGFHEYLAQKYISVDNLNKRWNLNIFSQRYTRFEQVPMPSRSWQNPHLLFEWRVYQAKAHIDFVHMQADILHKYTKAPVGTDMMPMLTEDYEKITEFLDVVQYNHYHDEKSLWTSNLWYDYLRTLKDRPFWNTETSTCWNGSTETPANIRPEGFCRVNSWLPIIHGGEANLYWLWRQHWAGHELMHGSVLYASGRPTHTFGEVKEIAEGYGKAADFLNNTKVKTDTAFHFSATNYGLMGYQAVMPEPNPSCWNSFKAIYTQRVQKFYIPMINRGIRPDVIGVKKSLDSYKLLVSAFMMTLEEEELPERIEKWVRNGGTWIAGPLTDVRDSIGAHYKDRETGMLERLTGADLVQQIPDAEHRVACSWKNGGEFLANQWLQLYDVPEDAEVLATVTGDYYSTIKGKAVAFKKKVGKGTVIVIGTIPSSDDLTRILDLALKESNAESYDFTGKITVAHRVGENDEGYVLAECGNGEGIFRFAGKMTDLLTGKVYENEAALTPYQVMVLKKI